MFRAMARSGRGGRLGCRHCRRGGIVVTATAGNWQRTVRTKRKASGALTIEALPTPHPTFRTGRARRGLRWRRVQATGEYLPRGMVLLDNKVRSGVAGYEVIMPLRITGSATHVLVNRGWIPVMDRRQLPGIVTPDMQLTVAGLAVVPGRFMELGKADLSGPVWQNLTIERYTERMKLEVLPVVIQQEGGADDGLQRTWPAPDFGIEKHYSYAVQWYSLCGLIVFLFFFFYVRNFRSRQNAKNAPVDRGVSRPLSSERCCFTISGRRVHSPTTVNFWPLCRFRRRCAGA
jgi:surfeit locus 1 family protein